MTSRRWLRLVCAALSTLVVSCSTCGRGEVTGADVPVDGGAAADSGSPPNCLSQGCDAGFSCELSTFTCVAAVVTDSPRYAGETIAGRFEDQHVATWDAVGLSAIGDFTLLVATRSGRYLYALGGSVVVRFDQTTGRVETLSGLGWSGQADGPADVAQFEVNFYQQGGLGLSPDESWLYFTAVHSVRKVNTATGEAFTVAPPEFARVSVRGLAVGASGALYLSSWGSDFYVMQPNGTVETRHLQLPAGWSQGWAPAAPPGFIEVDEARGWVYGLDRNYKSGALYRWPLQGGPVEWLNSGAVGNRDAQYTSDGPVTGVEMANPGGMTIDANGTVYIGAGDGLTFRRYNPLTQRVDSLCSAPPDAGAGVFEWCVGDGKRNKLFGTWPQRLVMDSSGNGYFGYTIFTRLVRLRRLP